MLAKGNERILGDTLNELAPILRVLMLHAIGHKGEVADALMVPSLMLVDLLRSKGIDTSDLEHYGDVFGAVRQQ